MDGLTASKWENEIQIFLTKGLLPQHVLGDLTRFRICLRTLLEFGIKYSIDNTMQVKCEIKEFKEFLPQRRHFVIQFTLLLAKNEAFDLTPIENLFDYSIERDDDEGNEQEGKGNL